jgi:hypothetical protein
LIECDARIRRIFKEYIEGRTVRDIAGRLNKDRIVPPERLALECVNDPRKIYVGQIVWNSAMSGPSITTHSAK